MKTITEILSIYSSTKKEEWKQYKNADGTPGGWVHSSAKINPIYAFKMGTEAVFRGGDFRGGDFRGGDFSGGDFRGGDFRGGYFSGGYFRGGYFRGGDFRGGDFSGGDFSGGDFRGGDFSGGDFRGGYFRGGDFRGGDFSGGDFSGGYFSGGYFRGGDFRGGDFRGGDFRGGDFSGGDFRDETIVWEDSPLQLIGRRWKTHQHGVDTIRCGCEVHTFKEWSSAKFMAGIFKKNDLTAEEKKEYKSAILFCIEAAKFFKGASKKK